MAQDRLTIGPFELLQLSLLLGRVRFDGVLHVRDTDVRRHVRIRFVDGLPHFCVTDDLLFSFPAHALRHQIAPVDTLRALLRQAEEHGALLEELLVERGLATEKGIHDAKSALSCELFEEVMGAAELEYRVQWEQASDDASVDEPLDAWVAFFKTVGRGANAAFQKSYLKERLGGAIEAPAFLETMAPTVEDVFGPAAAAVIELVERGGSVGEILRKMNGTGGAAPTLFALLFSRLATCADVGEDAPCFEGLERPAPTSAMEPEGAPAAGGEPAPAPAPADAADASSSLGVAAAAPAEGDELTGGSTDGDAGSEDDEAPILELALDEDEIAADEPAADVAAGGAGVGIDEEPVADGQDWACDIEFETSPEDERPGEPEADVPPGEEPVEDEAPESQDAIRDLNEPIVSREARLADSEGRDLAGGASFELAEGRVAQSTLVQAEQAAARGAASGGSGELPEEGDPSIEGILEQTFERMRRSTAYSVLDVPVRAPFSQIRESHQRLARKYDISQYTSFVLGRRGHRLLAGIRQILERAMRALTDPKLRPVYDKKIGVGDGTVSPELQDAFHAEASFAAGMKHLRKEDWDAGMLAFKAAIERFPHDPAYHAYYAWAVSRAVRAGALTDPEALEGAQRQLEHAVSLNPRLSITHLFRARMAQEAGDAETAAEAYQRVLTSLPDHQEARKAMLSLRPALESRRKKDRGGAFKGLFRRATKR